MQTLQTTSLRVSENQLFILDQQALPQEKRWLAADNVALLVEHIHALRVRGAPLIGLSASLLLALVTPGSRLLTHCNTGGLATAGVGTALGVIALAHQQGNVANVWVDETRPLLQGGRLTAWELGELGVPYRLITDSMAASLMAQGQVDAVWVGADRIAANGDVANKIGTYSLAVLAKYHQIPFYVAAPQTTLDRHCPNGAVQWAPKEAAVYNPAFDVTPASLISGWVLDSGVVTPEQVAAGAFKPEKA